MITEQFSTLLQILGSEQQILQRTDQKALTMLSIVGMVLVFFIVHIAKLPPHPILLVLMTGYFLFVFLSIGALLCVIRPRIKHLQVASQKKILANPTFFGGIAQYVSVEEYEMRLRTMLDDPDGTMHLFADNIFVLGKINAYKNRWLRTGIVTFSLAIAMELVVVMVICFQYIAV